VKRREFLSTVGAATAASMTPLHALIQSKGPFAIQFGYHAITWGGNDLQAIEEIAAGGFKGIQLRSNLIKEYGDKPNAIKDLLAKHKLTFVAFSSGNVLIDPAREKETIDLHTKHATFVKNAGGMFLQVTDERPKDRPVTKEDFARMGKLLTEIGKRCNDLGVKLGYHNHMNNLGEKPEEVDGVLAASDPKAVTFELDIAHYTQGGGDPVAAVKKYSDRLGFLHFKDVVATPGERHRRRRRAQERRLPRLGNHRARWRARSGEDTGAVSADQQDLHREHAEVESVITESPCPHTIPRVDNSSRPRPPQHPPPRPA
jgi:inosose dehydratase